MTEENETSTAPGEAAAQSDTPEAKAEKKSWKKGLFFFLKLAFTVGALAWVYRKVAMRDGMDSIGDHLADLQWGWIAASIGMLLVAMSFAVLRWRTLLSGQGIRPSWRFLIGSLMIARFWGAFTPGGFTGFGGWRIYDVAKHTGKAARAAATIGVEVFLGQMALGVVIIAGSLLYGHRFIGTEGVLIVSGFFVAVIAVAMTVLAKPGLFLWAARFLPAPIRNRVQTLVVAIRAYEGKGLLLAKAFAFGVGVHAFNGMIYVCASRALNVELSVGEVFFASNLQILATLVPASINGIGLRETAAVALYTSDAIGLPLALAVLIPSIGFACEMFVSAFGGPIFLARRSDYQPEIEVDEIEAENEAIEAIEEVPRELQPKPVRAITIGLGAGLVAGMIIGITEGAVILMSSAAGGSTSVLAYGAVLYGVFCALACAGFAWALALSGRFLRREAMKESDAYARLLATFVAGFAFVIGFFRVRRDIFHEELVLKSGKGLAVLLACAIAAQLLYLALSATFRFLLARKGGRIMLRAWGSPVVAGAVCGALALFAVLGGEHAAAEDGSHAAPSADQNNVIFVVVDTLRADHLPAYGYDTGNTPNLDAFAADAIRFDQAFANASWTRPSFASILSGRLPTNHGVMGKADSLPDEIVTLPEAMQEAGYHTRGLVTNFNVAPYYNFQQGFDHYEFLEPDHVLGADDSGSKLLLHQVLRRVVEKVYAIADVVYPGGAYQDAEVVNRRLGQWMESADEGKPFFWFVGYMDPHDPYFVHPYDGNGYARAAHQHPEEAEAPELRRMYDGEITYWDEHFGNLVQELKDAGLYEDTTIIITADHGEEFCDHGGFWHGTTLYDEQIRVPLFVKLPGNQRGGTTVRHWVQSIDLMPSLLKQLDLEIPEGVQGGDVFEGTDVVYAEESHEGNVLESIRERRGTDEWKLIIANEGNPRGLEPTELYRVDFDPGEQTNRAEDESEVAPLRETLDRERARASEGAAETVTRELSPEEIEANCNLGYWSREACCEQGFQNFCD
ncbi:MAG: sulfatase-like hydrolase/transferase [Deltaproteobacteria bacterium]|nr:sulfatase-like hydrolase/transferase [Deltaproteobacteria bacterium]